MMDFQRSAVKNAARTTLSHARPSATRLVLLHTGITLLVTLVSTLVDYLLEQKIGTTGGLSGISTRSALMTAQIFLRCFPLLLWPAWNCGYLSACLGLSRQEQVEDKHLLAGLFRFGPVFRLTLLKTAIYAVIGFGCIYIASAIFMFTPWADPLLETMEPMLASGEINQEALLVAMEPATLPLVCIFCFVFLAACIPVYYALWLTDFCIMDSQPKGALAALLESLHLTKNNRMALLKLDFSFWWFYLLDFLVSLLCYADVFLTLLGFPLPWSAGVNSFVALGVFSLAQLGLYAWKKNDVFLTYAHTYNTLKTPV